MLHVSALPGKCWRDKHVACPLSFPGKWRINLCCMFIPSQGSATYVACLSFTREVQLMLPVYPTRENMQHKLPRGNTVYPTRECRNLCCMFIPPGTCRGILILHVYHQGSATYVACLSLEGSYVACLSLQGSATYVACLSLQGSAEETYVACLSLQGSAEETYVACLSHPEGTYVAWLSHQGVSNLCCMFIPPGKCP